MNTLQRALFSLAALAAVPMQAQFNVSDIRFWVGSGADTSVLVVDFQDGSTDPSYAWGYLHDGATAEQMLNDIAAADVNFSVGITSGFLNDLAYGSHAGNGGEPDYWSTWSGTSVASFEMNSGISTLLGNGDWFGCSYTDFAPALAPDGPIAAFEPYRFTVADVDLWVGVGPDTALLVIDFQDGSGTPSYAWGYLYSGAVTAETMLADIAAADPSLDAVISGGFLMDLTYGPHAGLGGDPDYWSTWSGTNLGDWSMNMGLGTELGNGALFGCSYTDFAPALRPTYPVPAGVNTAVADAPSPASFQVYPQPATDLLHVDTGAQGQQPVVISDVAGHRVYQGSTDGSTGTIDVGAWPAGLYLLQVGGAKRMIAVQ